MTSIDHDIALELFERNRGVHHCTPNPKEIPECAYLMLMLITVIACVSVVTSNADYAPISACPSPMTSLFLRPPFSLEDTIGPVQEALADRDAADDALDNAAQTARLGLASRSVGADKKEPYTLIFHDGIGYYTAATLDQEEIRYGELKTRLVEHLPANDAVRASTCNAIDAGIVAFKNATIALNTARTQESLAKTRLDSAEEAWERQMTKVYGILVAELGRSAAESFFPKTRATKSKSEDNND